MRVFVLVLLLNLIAGRGHAGPWQREPGQWFVATGSNVVLSDGAQLPVHYDPTVYLEYGVTPLVTVGLDYHTADRGRIHTGFVFASFPLIPQTGRDRLAASLGFGGRIDEYSPLEKLTRGGLAWGRGLDNGWLAAEASATYGTIDQVFRPKLDLTWGYNIDENWTTSLQLQTGEGYADDRYAKVAASISYGITDRYRVNLGWVKGITGDRGGALKIDLWATF